MGVNGTGQAKIFHFFQKFLKFKFSLPNINSVYKINPNLLDPVDFVPFGKIKYSIFDINLINTTCI